MEIFLNVLQGAYAYLLIFQILVVTALLLALLWLVVRRTKEAALAGASSGARVAAIASFTEATAEAIQGGQPVAAGIAAPGAGDASQLQEKVRYLESKLLEYEILQEEISALSALKIENEELRKKLLSVEKGGTAGAVESASFAPPSETTTAPVDNLDVETVQEALGDSQGGVDGVSEAASDSKQTEPTVGATHSIDEAVREPGVAGTAEQDMLELESLLSKIDELTKEGDEPPPGGAADKTSKTL